MLTSSAKAKGRALAKWLRNRILDQFPALTADDVRVTSSGAGGEDVTLSSGARRVLPYQFECKSYRRFAVYDAYDQAVSHGPHTPVVVIKQNGRDPLVILHLDDWLDLVARSSGSMD